MANMPMDGWTDGQRELAPNPDQRSQFRRGSGFGSMARHSAAASGNHEIRGRGAKEPDRRDPVPFFSGDVLAGCGVWR